MNPDGAGGSPLPCESLRTRLHEGIEALERAGETAAAAALRESPERWWNDRQEWNTRLMDTLGVHHEINNALVGVRGNAHLLLMNPAGQMPGVRERLEVMLRESGRIQEAAGRLRELKTSLGGKDSQTRAA